MWAPGRVPRDPMAGDRVLARGRAVWGRIPMILARILLGMVGQ
jgi:hypothetical protein